MCGILRIFDFPVRKSSNLELHGPYHLTDSPRPTPCRCDDQTKKERTLFVCVGSAVVEVSAALDRKLFRCTPNLSHFHYCQRRSPKAYIGWLRSCPNARRARHHHSQLELDTSLNLGGPFPETSDTRKVTRHPIPKVEPGRAPNSLISLSPSLFVFALFIGKQ